MTQLFSIARPYANAAFDYAREHEQLTLWKAFLESAAIIARDAALAKLISNPQVNQSILVNVFTDMLASTLNAGQKNFLLLLAENNRLNAIPDISTLFDAHYAALQKISDVRVTTAVDVKDDFKQKLSIALSNRIKNQVTLHCEVDPAIIGGAIIQMGDHVIDGSVRGKLKRLEEALTS